MSWVDDLLGKTIMQDDTILPDRKILRFLQGDGAAVVVADNTTEQSTDVTISGGVASTISVNQSPTVGDSGAKYNNDGASGDLTVNLPDSPPVGTTFHGRVTAAHYLIFKANTGQFIRDDSAIGASAGSMRSSYIGATISIEAIKSTLWLVTISRGPWDLA